MNMSIEQTFYSMLIYGNCDIYDVNLRQFIFQSNWLEMKFINIQSVD